MKPVFRSLQQISAFLVPTDAPLPFGDPVKLRPELRDKPQCHGKNQRQFRDHPTEKG